MKDRANEQMNERLNQQSRNDRMKKGMNDALCVALHEGFF